MIELLTPKNPTQPVIDPLTVKLLVKETEADSAADLGLIKISSDRVLVYSVSAATSKKKALNVEASGLLQGGQKLVAIHGPAIAFSQEDIDLMRNQEVQDVK
jgi:hypothetical protein